MVKRTFPREGDVVILATDGLLDNMYEVDIVQCVSKMWETGDGTAHGPAALAPPPAAELALALSHQAYELSRDKERVSPWEEEAVAAGVVPRRGVEGSSNSLRPGLFTWGLDAWGLAVRQSFGSRAIGSTSGLSAAIQSDNRRVESSRSRANSSTAYRGGKTDDITVVVATVLKER